MGYLTPSTSPTSIICRTLFIPDNEEFLANVTGALQTLTLPENWTKFGTLTPDQAASALVSMFDHFCFDEGRCAMVGEIMLWSGILNPDPYHWLLCDGMSLSSVNYPDLYAVIGTTYGGTGPTDFFLPDLRGRVPMGESATHLIGNSGGADTVTLSIAEMPSHAHSTGNSAILGTSAPPPLDALGPNPLPAFTGNQGGGAAHNNLQPFVVMNYYIDVL